jgi:hypothetical protein
MWLAIAAYVLIGLWISKRFLPSWKYNQLRVVLLWPILVLFRIVIGKIPGY